MARSVKMYFNSTCIALLSVLLLCFLHWNFSSKSIWDYFYEYQCKESPNIITCSVIYGCIENVIFFTMLIVLYQLICHYHWKWRYHSDIRQLISQLAECKTIRENTTDDIQPIEETTKNMGYKIDPFIITFPWLMSPILKWNALTNFLIHLSYYITYYNLPFLDDTDNNATPLRVSYSKSSYVDLNFPKIINPFPKDYDYNDNITLHYSVFRTIWSFLIWYILDWILWKQHYGLTYLFETGINKVMERYTKEHCSFIHNLLLPHVNYITDLSHLIVEFHGNRPLEQFILIKVKLHECLKLFQLELLFNVLSIFTVVGSSLRIYYTPAMVNLMNPICYVLGVTAFVIFVIILVFNGVGSDAMHLIREFEEIFNYSTQIGVIVLSVLWAVVVWYNMKQKKVALVQQQSRSLVKDFLHRILLNPAIKKEFERNNINETDINNISHLKAEQLLSQLPQILKDK